MSATLRPALRVFVRGDTATVVDENGATTSFSGGSDLDVRQAVVAHAVRLAHQRGRPVAVETSGDRGSHRLEVGADGQIRALSGESADAEAELTEMPATSGDTRGGAHTVKLDGPEAVTTRASFIDGSAERDLILSTGLHGWLRKLGLVHSPTAAEVARHRRVQIVAGQWAGPRTIAVVNGKGGVGKTPTTAMLSAVYARFGGGSVLAFDNNDTRGTLGWRTEQGRHESTIADLLAAADSLQGAPTSAMAAYIHHQTDDRYDVLRSNPRVLSADQRLTTREFDTLVSTVGRGYRLVVFDSGNDESADRWLRMIDWANQLVVPTVTSPESAESAALLLEALAARDEHSALLARDAVVVITQAEPAGKARVAQLVETFSSLARAVAVIPFDPALKDGPLRFGALRAATREAWIEAAAYTADRF